MAIILSIEKYFKKKFYQNFNRHDFNFIWFILIEKVITFFSMCRIKIGLHI